MERPYTLKAAEMAEAKRLRLRRMFVGANAGGLIATLSFLGVLVGQRPAGLDLTSFLCPVIGFLVGLVASALGAMLDLWRDRFLFEFVSEYEHEGVRHTDPDGEPNTARANTERQDTRHPSVAKRDLFTWLELFCSWIAIVALVVSSALAIWLLNEALSLPTHSAAGT